MSNNNNNPTKKEEKPKERPCGVCGKPTTVGISTPICREDLEDMKKVFTEGVLMLRKKKADENGEQPEPIEVEIPPDHDPNVPIPIEPPHDKYQIKKLYGSDMKNGQVVVHYMDMNNPSSDPLFRNEEGEGLVKGQFGGFRSQGGSNGQLRIELWDNDGIRDMEGTVYAKWISAVNTGKQGAYLFQIYRGGGSHSSSLEGQEGAALKGRVREDGSVVVCKELRHADYTSNEGNIRKLRKSPKDTFIGVKLVVYNMQPIPGNSKRIPVKIEVWCDEDGMDANGNFDPKRQNWQKYAEYIDKGGWSSGNGGGNPAIEIGNTGLRKADEILNTVKGAVRNKGNLFAYRTDHVITEFKLLSFRKIKNPVGAS